MTEREAIEILSRPFSMQEVPKEILDAHRLAISALEKQERETQEKPFPFVVGQPAEMFFNGKWEKGKIVAGYRFGDGVVTIETEDGRRIWCGQDRTDIYRPYQEDEA
jgi:hypothetical protein